MSKDLTKVSIKGIEELIPVYETSIGEKVVNGRELYEWLESKQDFSTWIKKRINESDAIENEDYFSFHKKMEREIGATNRIEYIIKLDIAKEMAMLERNEKGKKARRYFIEAEKIMKQQKEEIKELNSDLKDMTEIAISDKEQEERILEANKISFSERMVQKSFANCDTYEEYLSLYSRFIDHVSTMSAETRVKKYRYAVNGMEKLRHKLLIESMDNIGNTINIDRDIKQLLKQIDKVNNKKLGGDKAAKTKKIKKLENKITSIPKCYEIEVKVKESKNKIMDIFEFINRASM